MRVALALLLAVLVCAAVDTGVTRHALFHRPHDWALPAQALLAWLLFALLVWWPASLVARRLKAPFTASLLLLAGPVLVHAAVRDAARHDPVATVALLGAAALLAVAVGAWVLRAAERGLATLHSNWPRRLVLLGALVALLPGHVMRLESRAAAPVADSDTAADRDADTRPRNVLLLIWDTTRADRLTPWGHDRDITPHLAALADEGLVFENCWSASVFTLSSHVSMLTGLPPSLHGSTLRRQTVRSRSVASDFRDAGYRTAAFVGTSVLAAGRGLERGFEVYDDLVDPPVCDLRLWRLVHDVQAAVARLVPALRGNGNPHWFQDFQRPASDVLAQARTFLEADDSRPWFVMINLFDAHWPYLPEPTARERWVRPYDGPIDGYLFRANDWPRDRKPDAADKVHVSDLYEAELWDLDRVVDRFLGEVLSRHPHTGIVMTSDHGEGLGEHDRWSHDDLHGPQTHVPFIVHAPGLVTPGRSAAQSSGLDVAPTLLALAELPFTPEVKSAALALSATAPADWPERDIVIMDFDNPLARHDSWALISGAWKLLIKDGAVTLHDLRNDPLDLVDLSAQHGELFAKLKARLDALLADSRAAGEGRLDNLGALTALGYMGDG